MAEEKKGKIKVPCPFCGETCGFIIACANCNHGAMDNFQVEDVAPEVLVKIGEFALRHRIMKPLTGQEPA